MLHKAITAPAMTVLKSLGIRIVALPLQGISKLCDVRLLGGTNNSQYGLDEVMLSQVFLAAPHWHGAVEAFTEQCKIRTVERVMSERPTRR